MRVEKQSLLEIAGRMRSHPKAFLLTHWPTRRLCLIRLPLPEQGPVVAEIMGSDPRRTIEFDRDDRLWIFKGTI